MMSYCEFSVVPFGLFTAKWHVTKISKKSILKKDIIEVYNIKKMKSVNAQSDFSSTD